MLITSQDPNCKYSVYVRGRRKGYVSRAHNLYVDSDDVVVTQSLTGYAVIDFVWAFALSIANIVMAVVNLFYHFDRAYFDGAYFRVKAHITGTQDVIMYASCRVGTGNKVKYSLGEGNFIGIIVGYIVLFLVANVNNVLVIVLYVLDGVAAVLFVPIFWSIAASLVVAVGAIIYHSIRHSRLKVPLERDLARRDPENTEWY